MPSRREKTLQQPFLYVTGCFFSTHPTHLSGRTFCVHHSLTFFKKSTAVAVCSPLARQGTEGTRDSHFFRFTSQFNCTTYTNQTLVTTRKSLMHTLRTTWQVSRHDRTPAARRRVLGDMCINPLSFGPPCFPAPFPACAKACGDHRSRWLLQTHNQQPSVRLSRLPYLPAKA